MVRWSLGNSRCLPVFVVFRVTWIWYRFWLIQDSVTGVFNFSAYGDKLTCRLCDNCPWGLRDTYTRRSNYNNTSRFGHKCTWRICSDCNHTWRLCRKCPWGHSTSALTSIIYIDRSLCHCIGRLGGFCVVSQGCQSKIFILCFWQCSEWTSVLFRCGTLLRHHVSGRWHSYNRCWCWWWIGWLLAQVNGDCAFLDRRDKNML